MAGPTPRDLLYAAWVRARPTDFRAMSPTMSGLRYGRRRPGAIDPVVDVYLPAEGERHPSVIIVHGGGFMFGSRVMKPVRLLATHLWRSGFAVCTVDYRLLFRGGGLDAQLDDVDAAAEFWRARCEGLGCDPARISMLGLSSGASLMMLSAERATTPYHRLVSLYGVLDYSRVRGRTAELLIGTVLGTHDRQTWATRSPTGQVPGDPPLLLIHGTEDKLVPPHHSIDLHERRAELGLPTRLELFEGMRHGWLNDASLPETDQAVNLVLEFLR